MGVGKGVLFKPQIQKSLKNFSVMIIDPSFTVVCLVFFVWCFVIYTQQRVVHCIAYKGRLPLAGWKYSWQRCINWVFSKKQNVNQVYYFMGLNTHPAALPSVSIFGRNRESGVSFLGSGNENRTCMKLK